MNGDLQRIGEALSFVDPTCRETWVKMGMAIKSEVGDAGFDVWDSWSQQADTYTQADARDVWKSVKVNGKTTIGTLFFEAKRNGWRDDGARTPPTAEELAERRRESQERAAREHVQTERKRAVAASKAAAIWEAATDPAGNPYLERKAVAPVATLREIDATKAAKILGYVPKSGGEPLTGLLLVVRIKISEGLSTLELIDESGRKAALVGGVKKAGCWASGALPDGDGAGTTLLIGEGVATCLSAREASGHLAVAALSAGNLPAVARAMRDRYPAARLIVLADLVKATGEPDPHAIEAARAVGGMLAVPDFGPEREPSQTDFNDLHQAAGLEVVERAIEAASVPAGVEHGGDLAGAVLRQAIERLSTDPGAALTDEAAAAWSEVYATDPAEFERLRKRAKEAGARVGEIDKRIGIHARHAQAKPKAQTYFAPNPSDPSGIRAESLLLPSGELPKAEELIPVDALLWVDKKGESHRLIESQAAEVVAGGLKNRLAWDGEAATWMLWRETHWEALTVANRAERLLADAVHLGARTLGFRPSYLNGVTQIVQRRGLLQPTEPPTAVIPFANGLLDLATGRLSPATPARALTWCLPHRYDPEADCPTIKAWLLRCVEEDKETVELLRAWLAALVRGIPLQKFLLLLGRGKSGKGTFQRLAIALVGTANNAVCSLRDLEENRFETAKLYGKRLCTINESGKHGGTLNMLKAVTGGDHLPLERKHQQQHGSFVFGGLVLMATNEDLQSTDSTSGLERRRITVRFPVSATPDEIARWEARGGEEAVLHAEIPGLINWLLALSPADIRARIDDPPARVVTDNLLGMAAGNSVADWLLSETVPESDAWTQIGTKKERRDPATGEVYFEQADERLYPSYLTWCLAHGRSRPVASRKFRDTVADMAETLGHRVTTGRHPETRANGVNGLRLARKDDSAPEDAWKKKGGFEVRSRKDRKDSGPNFGPDFSPPAADGDAGEDLV